MTDEKGTPEGERTPEDRDDGTEAAEEARLHAHHGGTGTEIAEEVVEEVDELRGELQTLNDRHLRLAAEFDNYRKRNERERAALATRLQLDLVSSLLDVLDDLQRVADLGTEAKTESVVEGVRLVEKKFRSVLEGAGLDVIEAEERPFDPEVMEALMTVPTADPEEEGRVADVFQRGYRFRDVLVRPARVRVWEYDGSEESE